MSSCYIQAIPIHAPRFTNEVQTLREVPGIMSKEHMLQRWLDGLSLCSHGLLFNQKRIIHNRQ